MRHTAVVLRGLAARIGAHATELQRGGRAELIQLTIAAKRILRADDRAARRVGTRWCRLRRAACARCGASAADAAHATVCLRKCRTLCVPLRAAAERIERADRLAAVGFRAAAAVVGEAAALRNAALRVREVWVEEVEDCNQQHDQPCDDVRWHAREWGRQPRVRRLCAMSCLRALRCSQVVRASDHG